jgi:hypothetical protein
MFKYIKDKINKVDKKTKIVFGIFAFILILVMRGNVGNYGTPEELRSYFDEAETIRDRLNQVLASDRVISQYVGMISIADYGMIDIPEELIAYSGRDIGFTKDIKVFSWFPIGLQMITVPFYWIGKLFNMSLVFAHFPVIIISFLNLILLYKISRNIFKLDQKTGLLVSYVYGFASVALVYSVMYIPHQVSTFLLLSCFYLAWKLFETYSLKKKVLFMSSIWLLWSTSSFFDYPNWVIISPVFLYIFCKILSRNQKKKEFLILFITSIFGVIGLFGQGLYNHIVYDNWQQMSNTLPQYNWRTPEKLNKDIANVEEESERKNEISSSLRGSNLKKGLHTLLISLDRGLFVFSPMFILALLGYIYFIKKRNHEKIFLLYVPLFTLFIYAIFGDAWGGFAYGARYLLPVMAMLSISLGLIFHRFRNLYFRTLFILLVVFSAIQSVAGVMSTTIIPKGNNTMIYGIKNYYLLMENVSGNFWYEVFLESSIPVISMFSIVLMLVLSGLLVILKD